MKTIKQMARLPISQLECELDKVAEKYGEETRAKIVIGLIDYAHGKAVA